MTAPVAPSLVVMDAADLERRLEAAVERALARARASEPSDWLDADGVASMLGIHKRSVQKLATRSGLPAHRFGAKLLRYRRAEVLAWAEEQGRRAR